MKEKESLDTLGLKSGASHDEIKKRYRQLAKKTHPDLNKDNVRYWTYQLGFRISKANFK